MTVLASEARAEDPTVKDKARECRVQATIAGTECPADEPIPYKKCFDDTHQRVFKACMEEKPETPSSTD